MIESHSEDSASRQSDEAEVYCRIGRKLRKRREALGLRQDEVAQRLHMPGMVINDLETGRVAHFSGLYRRGYLRNYARLLELDPDAILAEAGEDVPPALQQVMPASGREWRLERYLKIATYVLVTTVIVPPLAYFFIAGGSRILERDSSVVDSAPVERAAGASSTADADDGADSGPEAFAENAPEKPARHVSASVLPVTPMRPAQSAVPAQSDPAGASDEVDSIALELAADPRSTLSLELVEDSWVEIHDAEGSRLEYDLLRSGQVRQYEGLAPFSLLIGRASAVSLEVDGQAVVWEGHDSGDVARIEIQADGAVQR
ncbi:MAG: DUF4115 domain-containing protein [Gammaproteobacteria bacterium]|jgi:cytoskeleton protein RodZ|nr:DUF4115 domain-containing protein [Gammaproteobacteria bacterium]